jgi:hypothetical protein
MLYFDVHLNIDYCSNIKKIKNVFIIFKKKQYGKNNWKMIKIYTYYKYTIININDVMFGKTGEIKIMEHSIQYKRP